MTALTLRRTEEQGCLTQKYENKTELKILKKKTKQKNFGMNSHQKWLSSDICL